MGLLNEQEVQAGQIQFVGVDKTSGKFVCNKSEFAGIEGYFVGIAQHDFEWQEQMVKKLDLYLTDNGTIYQVQLGFYSYISLSVLNSLASCESLQTGGKLRLTLKKAANSNISIFCEWNKKPLKWKFSFDELKLTDIKEKTAQRTKRDKIIDKWYEQFYKLIPFVPEAIPEESEAQAAAHLPDDDLPF